MGLKLDESTGCLSRRGWSNGRHPNDLRLWTDRNAVRIVSFSLIPMAEETII